MRIAFRIWQLYWCHIALFFAVVATLIFLDNQLEDANRNYLTTLNLRRFVNNPVEFLPSLFGLHYALSWRGKWWAMGFCILLWALASQPWLVFVDLGGDHIVQTKSLWVWFKTIIGIEEGFPVFQALNLPAEPVTRNDRNWFFKAFQRGVCWRQSRRSTIF